MNKQNRIKLIFALVLMVLVEAYLVYLFVGEQLGSFKFVFYSVIMGSLIIKNGQSLIQELKQK